MRNRMITLPRDHIGWMARLRAVPLIFLVCWLAYGGPVGAQPTGTNEGAGRTLDRPTNGTQFDRLADALSDASPLVRRQAAEALGKLGDAWAVGSLIKALHDGSPEVRWVAAEALGKLGGAQAVEPLIKVLADADRSVGLSAAFALCQLGDERGFDPLVRALDDEYPPNREAAMRSLGKLRDARADKALIKALGDESPGVSQNAAMVLLRMPRLAEADRWAAALAGGSGWPARMRGGTYLIGEPRVLTWNYLSACLKVFFTGPSIAYSGILALAFALPVWFWVRRRRQAASGIGAWLAWGWVWVVVTHYLAYGLPGLFLGLGLGFVPGWFWFRRLKWRMPRGLVWLGWAGASVALGLDLTYGGPFGMVILALGLGLPAWWVSVQRQTEPALGGWIALGWAWVLLLLYGIIMCWTLGTAVFLTVGLIPAWSSLLLIGIGFGARRWPPVQERVAGFICRGDFHRFVPGPRLGWLSRWTGRWLWREKDAPKDMADSCVCRVCGKSSRYEGVKEVVGVLDHGGSYPQQNAGVLRINWLAKKLPFDFDRVEVIGATDTEAEEFVRQMRYQSDLQMQKRLPKMQCVVNAQCRFERENTMTLLRQTFCSVTKD